MPQWKQFSGIWTATQQAQAKGAGTWPGIPGAPTIGTATEGVGEISVAFTAPANPGYPTTLTYEVTSSPGSITASGSASPIVVTGLTNGTEYTFTVTATNDTGTGPASASSNAVTPIAAGAAFAWGDNASGQFGLGTETDYSSPVQVPGFTNWTGVSANIAGFVLATNSSNQLYSWGINADGQLGLGDTVTRREPVRVGALSNWKQVGAGGFQGVAIKTDGTLWAWGRNSYGQLGTNNTVHKSSPVQITASSDWAIVAGTYHQTFAIKTNGALYAWGRDQDGMMAQNTINVHRSSPTQVGALTNWATVLSCGGSDAMVAVKTDGTLWSWGSGSQGVQGSGSTIAKSSPVQVGALTNWKQAHIGSASAKAIKTDGTAWGWGSNNRGNIGDTSTVWRSSPVQIGGQTGWTDIFTPNTALNAYGVRDGNLYAWGEQGFGAVGNNTTAYQTRSSPVQIGASSDWFRVSGGEKWAIALGPTS